MTTFTDKVAVVTGAGSGIGRATCLRFASEGANVAVAEIDETTGRSTADEIKRQQTQGESRGDALFVRTEVSS